MEQLERVTSTLDEWRPSIQGTVDDIKLEVSKTKLEISKISRNWERAILDQPATSPSVFAAAPANIERPSAGAPATSPNGHRVDNSNRESGFGVVSTLVHSPVTGMNPPPSGFSSVSSMPPPLSLAMPPPIDHGFHSGSTAVGHNGFQSPKLPKFDFPKFDGSQPKYWLSQCKDYFELYGTNQHMWVRVAKMNFMDDAKRWYSSVESTLQNCSWPTFTSLILERVGQDEKELLLRQLFQICQTASVNKYITHFTPLIDQLTAYGGSSDPLFYTMRFVDGLKDYIKAVVALHRPQTFDTACVLARLQEDVADPARSHDLKRWDNAVGMRPNLRRHCRCQPHLTGWHYRLLKCHTLAF